MLTNDDLKWILVDFDKTICYNDEHFNPLEPIEGAKEALEELQAQGFKIIIYTARSWSEYQLVENWLINFDIPFRRIVCGKPLGRYIIDDKNIEFKDWTQVKEAIWQKEIEFKQK